MCTAHTVHYSIVLYCTVLPWVLLASKTILKKATVVVASWGKVAAHSDCVADKLIQAGQLYSNM